MQKITFEQEIHTFHIDFLGHVNNGIYIQWMEIGRTKLLEAAGMVTAEILKQSFAPLLVETTIRYKVPLYLGDHAHVEVWLSELRNTTGVLQFRFYNGQQVLVAEGNQRGVFIDTKSMQPRRLLPEEKALFVPFLETNNEDQP
ncbi:MAG TPA: thioesterase family protein [Anaerolineales bacterium]|nr:thioesterase family protein [Anaerolineales bacterium]